MTNEQDAFQHWHKQRWPSVSLQMVGAVYADLEVQGRWITWCARAMTHVGTAKPRYRNRDARLSARIRAPKLWAVYWRVLTPEHSVRNWTKGKSYATEQAAFHAARDQNREAAGILQYVAYPLHLGVPPLDIPTVLNKIGTVENISGYRIYSRFRPEKADPMAYNPWVPHPKVHETSGSAFLAIPENPPHSQWPGTFEFTVGKWPGFPPEYRVQPIRSFTVKGWARR